MKLPYSEGSAFLVPLRSGGYARGIIARAAPKGRILMGYFFGPRLELPETATIDDLRAGNEVLRLRFGDLGLVKGRWPVLGRPGNWDRSEWPIPHFVTRDPLGIVRPILIQYSDDDPSKQITERIINDDAGLDVDSLAGAGFVEVRLDKILG
jgi:hypothetical protein